MAGCNWCGTTEVKLAENKPYCPDCASNCKRECTVCHKPYPNLKFYEKHSKRCNSCQSRYVVAKTKKASMENNRRKFGDTTGKQKQYDSDVESTSSGEEKEEDEEDEEDEEEVEEEEEEEEEEKEEYEVQDDSAKKEDCSNEVFSKTKNVQKASSTPPSKRQLTVMETLQINKMKRDKEAGDKKKKRKRGKKLLRLQQKSHKFYSR